MLRRVVSAILLVQKWLIVVQLRVCEVRRHGPGASVCCEMVEKVELVIVKSKYGRLNVHQVSKQESNEKSGSRSLIFEDSNWISQRL